jgi:anti-sigma B factor antagonist
VGSAERATGDGTKSPEYPGPDHLAEGLEPTAWPSATVAPMELSVTRPESGVSVIEIAGELDALTTPLLDECLREQRRAGLNHLVIDLSAVTFLGSSGLAALVQCSRKLEAQGSGSKVHLTGTSHRAIRRPLELVGLLPLFSVHATQDEAMADIAAGADRPI